MLGSITEFKRPGHVADSSRAMHLFADLINNAPKCEPRPSRIHGIGLFAKVPIETCESFMILLGGKIVPAYSYLGDDDRLAADEWNAISETELLVRSHRTLYYCINHHLLPNAFVDLRRREVIALTRIDADEEITLNYLWEPLPRTYRDSCQAVYLRKVAR